MAENGALASMVGTMPLCGGGKWVKRQTGVCTETCLQLYPAALPKKTSNALLPHDGNHGIKGVAVGMRARRAQLHARFDERERTK